jgi:Glycosyltransferase family 92
MKDRLRELTPSRVWDAAHRVRTWGVKLSYLRERWPRPIGTRPPVGLAVCAIFKDEARYLAEWVSFHRIQGVERFYLYDNRSTDDWRSALEPELAAGIVEVRGWKFTYGQLGAYEDCLRRHRDDARWIAFIDVDEFLFSPTGRPLREVLRGFDLHSGVAVNWRIYGANGFEHPPDGLVIENYLWRAPDDYPRNRWMKSIVNPRAALAPHSPHHFHLKTKPVDEDHRPAPWQMRPSVSAELLRINHYYSKSEEEFRRKVERIPVTPDPGLKRATLPPDTVRDETILQFDPQLRAVLASRQER